MFDQLLDINNYREFLIQNVSRWRDKRILVIGDIGLDEYVLGEVRRISPEAPVPVLEVKQESNCLGLAGNVAQNIASLGGTPLLVSVIGEDRGGELLREKLIEANVSTKYIVVDNSRPTTRKSRVMAGQHHIVRLDYEEKRSVCEVTELKIRNNIEMVIESCDGVILQDYGKGVLTRGLIAFVINLSKKHNKMVLLDPHKSTPLPYYSGVDLMTPNLDEALELTKVESTREFSKSEIISQAGRRLMSETRATKAIITLGALGMRLFANEKEYNLPTYAREVFDVTGAGDTVIATITLAICSDFTLEQACEAANFAAGVVVGKVGCVACSSDDLIRYISRFDTVVAAEQSAAITERPDLSSVQSL